MRGTTYRALSGIFRPRKIGIGATGCVADDATPNIGRADEVVFGGRRDAARRNPSVDAGGRRGRARSVADGRRGGDGLRDRTTFGVRFPRTVGGVAACGRGIRDEERNDDGLELGHPWLMLWGDGR
jgi:hypothetical protein